MSEYRNGISDLESNPPEPEFLSEEKKVVDLEKLDDQGFLRYIQ